MSATIYIMRHGIAEDYADSGDDADRRLTDEGRRKVLEIARGLAAIEVRPQAVLSSPLPRALETATLAVSVLDSGLEVDAVPALAIGHEASAVVAALEEQRNSASVLLVGHQPQLGELASYLLTGSPSLVPLPFKKGAVAAIAVSSLPPRYPGALQWFMSPKQLRALA